MYGIHSYVGCLERLAGEILAGHPVPGARADYHVVLRQGETQQGRTYAQCVHQPYRYRMKLLPRILNRIAFVRAEFTSADECRTEVFMWRTLKTRVMNISGLICGIR